MLYFEIWPFKKCSLAMISTRPGFEAVLVHAATERSLLEISQPRGGGAHSIEVSHQLSSVNDILLDCLTFGK